MYRIITYRYLFNSFINLCIYNSFYIYCYTSLHFRYINFADFSGISVWFSITLLFATKIQRNDNYANRGLIIWYADLFAWSHENPQVRFINSCNCPKLCPDFSKSFTTFQAWIRCIYNVKTANFCPIILSDNTRKRHKEGIKNDANPPIKKSSNPFIYIAFHCFDHIGR